MLRWKEKKVFPVSLLPYSSHSLSHTPYFKLQEKELPEERKALLDLIFLLLFHRALCFFYEGLKWRKLFSFQGSSLHSDESEAAAALQDLIHFTPQTDPPPTPTPTHFSWNSFRFHHNPHLPRSRNKNKFYGLLRLRNRGNETWRRLRNLTRFTRQKRIAHSTNKSWRGHEKSLRKLTSP